MGRLTRLSVGVGLTLITLVPQGSRYVTAHDERGRATRWRHNPIYVQVVASRAGAGFSTNDILQAARQAARGWSGWGVPSIVVARASVARSASEDGVNAIVVRDDGWCSTSNPDNCYDPRQVGITHPYSRVLDAQSPVAEIIEADIEINARSPYLGSAPVDQRRNRIVAVLTHEFGHLLGIDHNCSATRLSRVRDNRGAERPLCSNVTGRIRAEAMYPGLTESDRPLVLVATEEERLGVAAVYGNGWLEAISIPLSRGTRGALAAIAGILVLIGSSRRRVGPSRTVAP